MTGKTGRGVLKKEPRKARAREVQGSKSRLAEEKVKREDVYHGIKKRKRGAPGGKVGRPVRREQKTRPLPPVGGRGGKKVPKQRGRKEKGPLRGWNHAGAGQPAKITNANQRPWTPKQKKGIEQKGCVLKRGGKKRSQTRDWQTIQSTCHQIQSLTPPGYHEKRSLVFICSGGERSGRQ